MGIDILLLRDLVAVISVVSIKRHAVPQANLSMEATRTMLKVFMRVYPGLPMNQGTPLGSRWQPVKKTVGSGKCIRFPPEKFMRREIETCDETQQRH